MRWNGANVYQTQLELHRLLTMPIEQTVLEINCPETYKSILRWRWTYNI